MSAAGAQLLLPDGLHADALLAALADRVALRVHPAATVRRTFLDSFDGRLHAADLVLAHDGRRLALADALTYAVQAEVALAACPVALAPADLAPGALADRLADLLGVRAATPVAAVRRRLRPLRVLNEDDKTVVLLTVEAATVTGPGGRATRLPARVHVAPVLGYDRALERTTRVLVDELGLVPAPRPLHDEAVAAAGGAPGGTSSKLRVTLAAGQRADAAAATVLLALTETVRANLPGTLDDVDVEFLHDLRVAVRRSRAMQRELKGVFPPASLRRFRSELRRLQQVTGATRDLDVYLLELDGLRAALPPLVAPDVEPLAVLLAQRREAERRRMVRALSSARTTRLLEEWEEFLERLPEAPEDDRPDAARPARDVAGERIRAVYRRMVRMGRRIDDAAPAEALHELRKKGKELRYLLEFFADLYPPDAVQPMVKALKALQDTLGRFQDHEVQAQWLRSLRDDVAALERGPAALMAMGLLVQRLDAQQVQARAEFAERFADFAAKERRALVRDAFA